MFHIFLRRHLLLLLDSVRVSSQSAATPPATAVLYFLVSFVLNVFVDSLRNGPCAGLATTSHGSEKFTRTRNFDRLKTDTLCTTYIFSAYVRTTV